MKVTNLYEIKFKRTDATSIESLAKKFDTSIKVVGDNIDEALENFYGWMSDGDVDSVISIELVTEFVSYDTSR